MSPSKYFSSKWTAAVIHCTLAQHFEYLLPALGFISVRRARDRYIFMEKGGRGWRYKPGKYRSDSLLGRFMCRFGFARTIRNRIISFPQQQGQAAGANERIIGYRDQLSLFLSVSALCFTLLRFFHLLEWRATLPPRYMRFFNELFRNLIIQSTREFN